MEFCPTRASNSVTRAWSATTVAVRVCTADSNAATYAATAGGNVARTSSGNGGKSIMDTAYRNPVTTATGPPWGGERLPQITQCDRQQRRPLLGIKPHTLASSAKTHSFGENCSLALAQSHNMT